eukprot:TRINITY_DN44546_c0_g1_i1.p2 TRINITY_DN44546_c0_g1~~TRINITY_DN44546_c0_g1_i1.p2  ORF type:complete len:247 (+),score=75.03 TRINITY_DN44546_c0_g1_i1:42-743(+)
MVGVVDRALRPRVRVVVNGHPVAQCNEEGSDSFTIPCQADADVKAVATTAQGALPDAGDTVTTALEKICIDSRVADGSEPASEIGGTVEVHLRREAVVPGRIPRATVMAMFARENEFRLSKEVQDEYTELLIPFNGTTTANLQKRLLQEYGFPSCENGLLLWNTQRHEYQGDEEVLRIPLYVRQDVSGVGTLRVGDAYTDCRLVRADGSNVLLSDFVDQAGKQPLVIVGASYS